MSKSGCTFSLRARSVSIIQGEVFQIYFFRLRSVISDLALELFQLIKNIQICEPIPTRIIPGTESTTTE